MSTFHPLGPHTPESKSETDPQPGLGTFLLCYVMLNHCNVVSACIILYCAVLYLLYCTMLKYAYHISVYIQKYVCMYIYIYIHSYIYIYVNIVITYIKVSGIILNEVDIQIYNTLNTLG